MRRLSETFQTTITARQSMKLLWQKKDAKRLWAEHLLYLVAVSDARGGLRVSPRFARAHIAKYDPTRTDYLRHAKELTHFATSIKLESTCGKAKTIQAVVVGRGKALSKKEKAVVTIISMHNMVLAIGEIKSRKRGTRVGKERKSAAVAVKAVEDVDNSDLSDY
ncbi:unnamed protein product [Peronospora belbahrii]|uniref:Uncharacterized protein n=1 Tax=Peronospora belbahrii TaxID=622444 RepID=A0ABN8D2V5_9STRA|nr:unnamed protein product [Peronospora belbahrii]